MSDTVTRLMKHADNYALLNRISPSDAATFAARQALQDELTRLFTPLSEEQIESINNVWINKLDYEVFEIHQPSVYEFARGIENLHGIGVMK